MYRSYYPAQVTLERFYSIITPPPVLVNTVKSFFVVFEEVSLDSDKWLSELRKLDFFSAGEAEYRKFFLRRLISIVKSKRKLNFSPADGNSGAVWGAGSVGCMELSEIHGTL